MKVKTVVSVKYSSSWTSYNGLEITDHDGNTVNIEMSDNQLIELCDRLESRKKSILNKRKEEALELASTDTDD